METLTESFRLNPVALLHWVGWDDEYVVFEESSGQTHQLDAFRAFVLNAAIEGDLQINRLLEDVAGAINFQSPEAARQLLTSVIEEFETVGLLERSSV